MNGLEEKTGFDFVHINLEQLILEFAPGRQQKMGGLHRKIKESVHCYRRCLISFKIWKLNQRDRVGKGGPKYYSRDLGRKIPALKRKLRIRQFHDRRTDCFKSRALTIDPEQTEPGHF